MLKKIFGKRSVFTFRTVNTNFTPLDWAKKVEQMGAGEILLTSVDQEGTWNGFDLELNDLISKNISIPVIACGGANDISDINKILSTTNVSGVGLGNMVLYQKRNMGVLINFPDKQLLSL